MTITSLATGMLSFERSLQVSEALMFGIPADGGKKVPVVIVEKGVRGQTSSDFASEKDREKNAANSNIQTVHAAYVPIGCNALEIAFSLRVMPGSIKPHACNDPAVAQSYRELAALYDARGGYRHLAERYVWNLLNGRFAWRNGFQTDDASVSLVWGKMEDEKVAVRSVAGIGRTRPKTMDEIAALPDIGGGDGLAVRLNALVDRFAAALAGREPPLTIAASWTGRMEEAQEVFPSQEYLREEHNEKAAKKKGALSRVYAHIDHHGQPHASIHSQKIGAALRTIDDWHGREDHGVVSVNAYSGVQETGEVLRPKDNFYTKRAKPEALVALGKEDDLHFVMANLVRGGVYGAASAKEKKA